MESMDTIQLGSVAEIERAVAAPHEIRPDEPYVSLEDIDSAAGTVQCNNKRERPRSAKFRFGAHHVLYGKLRPYLAKVARPTIAGVCSTDILPIYPGSRLDRDYLFHYLRSPEFTAKASQAAVGANLPRVSASLLSTFHIPLPPFDSQRRIAAILDQADALRAKRREALAQLDSLAQSIFIEMFGDPVSNPKEWTKQSLVSLSERIQIGPFGSQLHEEDYIEGGIPLINPTHIKGGMIYPDASLTVPESKYQQLGQYHLSAGDLVMGRRGEMGRCAVISDTEQGWLCGTGSLFVRPDSSRLHPIYLEHVITSHSMRKHLENVAQGVTMANLNKDIVGALPIPTPPVQLQQAYVDRLASVESIRASQSDALAKTQCLFASLQHRAFRGEL